MTPLSQEADTHTPGASDSSPAMRQLNGPWLITLGDLLTLLLCFFIAVISLQTPGKSSNSSKMGARTAFSASSANFGTTLAQLAGDVRGDPSRQGELLVMTEQDFQDASLGKLWDLVHRRERAAITQVQLTVCSAGDQAEATDKLRTVVNGLTEWYGPTFALKLNEWGMGCDELAIRVGLKNDTHVRMVVEFERKALSHG